MSNKFKNILILSLALVAVIAANILLKNYMDKNLFLDSISDNQNIYISNYSVGTVEKIEIENDYGKVVLIQKDEVWHIEDNKEAEIDQGVVSELAYSLTHIASERTVSNTMDSENIYGILTPSATITTYHQNMVEQKFIIGDKAPIENEYYIESSIFKKVYTVDMAYYIYGQVKIEDLLLIKGTRIEHEKLQEIEIKNNKGEKFTIRRTAQDNDITLCYWEFSEPFHHDIDTAVMYGSTRYTGMITTILELMGDRVLDSDQNEVAKYGLDNPIFTAEILASDMNTQSFAIGDYGEKDIYSLKFGDDNNIYSISKEAVAFVDYSAYMIADANLDLINITTVDGIRIDLPGLQTTIDVDHVLRKTQDGANALDSDGNLIYDNIISLDTLEENIGGIANMDQQKIWFYQDIVTIKIDDLILEIEDNSIGEKIGSIEFLLNSKYKSNFIVELYEYNKSHYIAKKNGEDVVYLVNKEAIDELVKRYYLLLSGQMQRDY